MSETKFCRDCAHFVRGAGREGFCARPGRIDVVNGETRDWLDARVERANAVGCGQSAQYFEPRRVFVPEPLAAPADSGLLPGRPHVIGSEKPVRVRPPVYAPAGGCLVLLAAPLVGFFLGAAAAGLFGGGA